MISKITDIVLIITGFQLVFLSLVLLFHKNDRALPRYLLVSFLAVKTILIIRWSIVKFSLIPFEDWYWIYFLSKSAFFLLAPLLYLHIKSLCIKNYHLHWKTLIHFIPAFIMTSLQIYIIYTQTLMADTELSHPLNYFIISHNSRIFWTGNILINLIYIFLMLRIIKSFQRQIKNQFSEIHYINLHWFAILSTVFLLYWIFMTSRSILSFLKFYNYSLISILDLLSITIFLGFTTLIVYKSLNQIHIFTENGLGIKYGQQRLKETDAKKYLNKILKFMESGKPYLKPSLTINELSKQVHIPARYISQVINEKRHQNFFYFINEYRIEEAKKMIQEHPLNKKTFLEIGYDVGFNSKSTFNQFFKHFTGMTPSEFKQSVHPK